jgi:DNA-binding transcriptional ArsR family regulator
MPIRSSYELTRLFLSLSDVTRQNILNQLLERTSVIDICTKFDLLVHEATRHLRRLEDVGLVRQLSNGEYIVTEYGKVLVSLVEEISTVHDLLEYWERHSAAELPTHLSCLPAQLNDSFIHDSELLHALAEETIRESRRFLWILNYPVDRATFNASELKILTAGKRSSANPDTRFIGGVHSAVVINERRALMFFPGVTAQNVHYDDCSTGFLIEESNPTYRLVAEFFCFLWDKKAKP